MNINEVFNTKYGYSRLEFDKRNIRELCGLPEDYDFIQTIEADSQIVSGDSAVNKIYALYRKTNYDKVMYLHDVGTVSIGYFYKTENMEAILQIMNKFLNSLHGELNSDNGFTDEEHANMLYALYYAKLVKYRLVSMMEDLPCDLCQQYGAHEIEPNELIEEMRWSINKTGDTRLYRIIARFLDLFDETGLYIQLLLLAYNWHKNTKDLIELGYAIQRARMTPVDYNYDEVDIVKMVKGCTGYDVSNMLANEFEARNDIPALIIALCQAQRSLDKSKEYTYANYCYSIINLNRTMQLYSDLGLPEEAEKFRSKATALAEDGEPVLPGAQPYIDFAKKIGISREDFNHLTSHLVDIIMGTVCEAY